MLTCKQLLFLTMESNVIWKALTISLPLLQMTTDDDISAGIRKIALDSGSTIPNLAKRLLY